MARSASTYWVGGGRVLVAKPEGNDGDVDSGLEQMHRGRVAQRVGRDPLRRERRMTLRGLSTGDAQLVLDAGARQGLASGRPLGQLRDHSEIPAHHTHRHRTARARASGAQDPTRPASRSPTRKCRSYASHRTAPCPNGT